MSLADCASRWALRLGGSRGDSRAQAAHYALYGDGEHLSWFVEMLASHNQSYSSFVDVGAAIYNEEDWGTGAAHFIRLWNRPPQRNVVVHAFEPTNGTLLDRQANVRVHHSLVSDHVGEITMFGTGATATCNRRLLVHPRWANAKAKRTFPVVTIDSLAVREGIEHVDILKIDAEGLEWEVLLGSHQLLARQRISVILFEYSLSWSASTYFSANAKCRDASRNGHNRMCSEKATWYLAGRPEQMEVPNLWSVTRHLSRLGYDSYLLGCARLCKNHCRGQGVKNSVSWMARKADSLLCQRAGNCADRLQFVPLSGVYWNDTFELGFDARTRSYLRAPYTWFDVVSVRTTSAENALIKRLACSAAVERLLNEATWIVENRTAKWRPPGQRSW